MVCIALLLTCHRRYRRTFIECYQDDAKTIAFIPFVHWPDPTRLKKNILNEYELVLPDVLSLLNEGSKTSDLSTDICRNMAKLFVLSMRSTLMRG